MKRTVIYIALILAVILAAGCPMNPSMFEEGDFTVGAPSGSFTLPEDQSDDTARSRAAVFEFKTFFPVKMTVNVDLYGPSADEDGEIGLLDPSAADVFLTLRDEEGNLVYEGMIGDDGILSADVFLPAAPEDMVLTLEAPGFEKRTVEIEEMVEYEKIERTIAMLQAAGMISARDAALENDRDGDGVPDDQDVSPDDPREAYAIRIPAEGNLSVAYEDLFGHADAGDADYNDFIALYNITEYVDAEGENLSRIVFEVTGREKIAGYNHLFGIRIDSFGDSEDTASVEGELLNFRGYRNSFSLKGLKAPLEVPVFLNTDKAVGETVSFTVIFDEVQNIDPDKGAVGVDRSPFNPYLLVLNTGHDIHLVGEETLRLSINPGAVYLDGNNFPWGLLVPAEWTPPEETKRIEDYYPDFTEWRTSKGELKKDWYLNYRDPNAPANNPPYPVIAPFTSKTYPEDTGIKTFQLSIDEQDGLKDPDGDQVFFRSSDLPDWITLDENTGEVEVDTTDSHSAEEILFWSEDENGGDTKDKAVSVTLRVVFS